MSSPSLHHLFEQAHIEELHRSRHTRTTDPTTTNERIAARDRSTRRMPGWLSRRIERILSYPVPTAYAI
jgi:hypothetical protein